MAEQVRFGLIGLGMMGKEFASAAARWMHLLGDIPRPIITAICNHSNLADRKWFTENFDTITLVTDDYREVIDSEDVDAIYCAVPHDRHEQIYIDILNAGKHLLGEKPFGIDRAANLAIVDAAAEHPELIVRCSSQFVFYPGAKRIIEWIEHRSFGRIMEVRAGFHHSSDMDLSKPIKWNRMIKYNGEYGSMSDLGFHTQLIPLRFGWQPKSVFAHLQNIATERPDREGALVACDTWDNATLLCECDDPQSGEPFSMLLEAKRMAPGATNTWYIEIYGTEGSAKFSTHDPRSFYHLETRGKEQGWTRTDIGADFWSPSITGSIFETGFSDGFQQMIAAYLGEFATSDPVRFQCGSVEETQMSHQILTAALESHKTGQKVALV